jgi:hypothetical protein
MAQEFGGGIRMLTHTIMFQPEYRPKFGVFVSAPGSGQPTRAAFIRIHGRSLGHVAVDRKLYAKQPSLSSANRSK